MTLSELLPKYLTILDEYYRITFRPKTTREERDQYLKDKDEVMQRLNQLYNPPPTWIKGCSMTTSAPMPIIEYMRGIYGQLKCDDKEIRDGIREALVRPGQH